MDGMRKNQLEDEENETQRLIEGADDPDPPESDDDPDYDLDDEEPGEEEEPFCCVKDQLMPEQDEEGYAADELDSVE